jgi:pimeloyl-ACP methyl ester carboxylesterase
MKEYSRGNLVFDVIDLGEPNESLVILLHGFPGGAASFERVAEALADTGHRVLVPQQRGYSPHARPRHRWAYALNELVDDAVALIDASGAKEAHVVGHDWGGIVGWVLADRVPERVQSLTIIATPHPRAVLETLWSGEQLALSWYMALFQLPRLPEFLFRGGEGNIVRKLLTRSGLSLEIADRYIGALLNDPGLLTGALNWYRGLPSYIAYAFRARPLTCRTQYILGENDVFVGRRAARHSARWVKGPYEFKIVRNGTHWLPEDDSDRLVSLLVEFLSPEG